MKKYYINMVNGSKCDVKPEIPSLMGGAISVDIPYIVEGENVILECLTDRDVNTSIIHVIGKKRGVVMEDVVSVLSKWAPTLKLTINMSGVENPILIIQIPDISKYPLLDVESLTESLGELLENTIK